MKQSEKKLDRFCYVQPTIGARRCFMREISVFPSRHNIYGIGLWGLTKQQRQGRSKE